MNERMDGWSREYIMILIDFYDIGYKNFVCFKTITYDIGNEIIGQETHYRDFFLIYFISFNSQQILVGTV